MTEISDLLANIKNTKTRDRLKLAVDIFEEKQPVPSIGLNLALQGGLGFGRMAMIWGNRSTGKSSFCLEMIAMAQKVGKTCLWIDVENAYSKEWGAKLGVDNSKLLVSLSKTTNDITEDIVEAMEVGIDIIVVDSISTMIPIAFMDKDGKELKSLEDSGKMASIASDLAKAAPMWNYANKNTLLILISQHTWKIGQTYSELAPTGGEKIQFLCSTIIKLASSEAKGNWIDGQVYSGDKIFNESVGRPVTWTVKKNRQGPMNRQGDWNFYFDGDYIGIDNVHEILDLAIKYGVITLSGTSWYTIDGQKMQGKESKIVEYLKENKEIYEKIRGEVFDIIG